MNTCAMSQGRVEMLRPVAPSRWVATAGWSSQEVAETRKNMKPKDCHRRTTHRVRLLVMIVQTHLSITGFTECQNISEIPAQDRKDRTECLTLDVKT